MRTVDQSTQNSSAVTESATQMTSTSQSSADVDELQSVLAAVLQSVGAEHIAADQLLKHLAVSAQPLAHDVLSAISSSAASLAQQISAAANKVPALGSCWQHPGHVVIRILLKQLASFFFASVANNGSTAAG